MTRVLLVEDNADLAFAVATALQSEGFDVAVAGTGPDGVARARAGDADLIILDLMLPGFDGYRVIRTLRDDGIRTPILVLTARGEEADKVRGLRLGADDYVTKPFGALELLARISALLRRARAAAPPPAPAAPAMRVLDDAELRDRYGLTDRQIAAARLMAEGCTNAELAARMGLSFFTARNHAEQVMAKLRVSNRASVAPLLHEPVGAGTAR